MQAAKDFQLAVLRCFEEVLKVELVAAALVSTAWPTSRTLWHGSARRLAGHACSHKRSKKLQTSWPLTTQAKQAPSLVSLARGPHQQSQKRPPSEPGGFEEEALRDEELEEREQLHSLEGAALHHVRPPAAAEQPLLQRKLRSTRSRARLEGLLHIRRQHRSRSARIASQKLLHKPVRSMSFQLPCSFVEQSSANMKTPT